MNFRDYIIEAEFTKQVQRNTNDYSYEGKWNHILSKNLKNTSLLVDKLKNDMKIYVYDDIYFLVDSEMKYLGYIELRTDSKAPRIVYSDSRLDGGFYLLMFSNIFKHTNIKEIHSDVSLSKNAYKSYAKLAKDKQFELQIVTKNKEYLPFSMKNLTNDSFNRISIRG